MGADEAGPAGNKNVHREIIATPQGFVEADHRRERPDCYGWMLYRFSRRPDYQKKMNRPAIGMPLPRLARVLLFLGAAWGLGLGRLAGAEAPHSMTESNLLALSLDELLAVKVAIVTSAAKYEQKTELAPASVTVVTDRDIQLNGYRNLAEVLGSVRGFYSTYDRNYHYLGVRGFNRPGDYNSRILILIDGHRANDTVYDSGPIGNDGYLDMDLIDRVEVVRGPGSAVYGSSAFFGVVNVVTRRGRDLNGAEAAFTTGAFDTYQGRFSYGRQLTNGVEFLLSGTIRDSAGHPQLAFPGTGTAGGLDGEAGRSLFAKLGLEGLALTAGFETRTKEIPTASYATVFNYPGNQTRDNRAFADLQFDHRWDEAGLALQARLYYDYDYYLGHYFYTNNPPLPATSIYRNVDIGHGERAGADVQVRKELGERHTLAAGLELRDNFKVHQYNYDENAPLAVNLNQNSPSVIVSPYLTSEWQLRSNLVLHAGARFDRYDHDTYSANPRLGLVWQSARDTVFKALYGTAFRAPNALELYYNDGLKTQKPASGLQPETVATYELVWEQALARQWQFTASAYFYKIHHAITQVTDPADGLLVFCNTGDNTGRGLETELAYKADNGFRSRLSYVFQESEDITTGAALSNSPKHLARWQSTLPLYLDKIFLSPELTYTSPVQSSSTSPTPGRVAGYWLLNTTLYARELVRGWTISASGYNLLDRRYYNAVGDEIAFGQIRQDGRSFQVKLTGRF
jgi:iron complex outermembrane receptor protein